MQMTAHGLAWPLAVYFFAVVGLVAFVLTVSHFLGERHGETATGEPFESGAVPVGSAQVPVPVKFYLMAVLFVLFDLEAVFVISWAVVARESGWAGYAEVAFFVAVLIAALIYLWRLGALDWGPKGKRKPPPPGHWTHPSSVRAER